MKLVLEKIKKTHKSWNEIQFTESDFYQFCDSQDILINETPMRYGVKAMLWFVEDQYVVTINARLVGVDRLFAMWHEIGHFTMHYPSKKIATYFWGEELRYGSCRREENEADAFALCAIIPKTWIETKTLRELAEDECISEDLIQKRKKVYERYKI